MVRNLLLFFSLLLFGTAAVAQTSLAGKVTDEASGEPILFGTVALYRGGTLLTGVETDFDGNYSFSNIDAGTYDVEFSYTGYQSIRIASVQVFGGKAVKLDAKLGSGVVLDEIVVRDYKVPLIQQDNTTQGQTITSEEIRNLPTRNINALAATTAGLASADEGGDISVRGSRSDATNYYIDGIRVQGSLIPESEIDQLQVITGGMEAQYGDVTGGIISITSKGPSDKYSGGFEVETTKFLDAFNQNLAGFNLSGPLLRNKAGQSVLGFRLSGRYTYQEDDDPTAVDVYRVTDEKLKELEANPVINVGGNPLIAADFLRDGDVNALKARPFEERTRYDATAKIDARLSKAIDISFTGAMSQQVDRFTPGGGSRTGANWRLLNSHNNPESYNDTYRGSFRFRHRLGGGASNAENRPTKASLIQNASYTFNITYERNLFGDSDFRHGENYFDYGHIGNFDIEWVPTLNPVFDPETGQISLTHIDNRAVLRGYTPGAANPVLANYNNTLGISPGDGLNSVIGDFVVSGVNDNVSVLAREAFNNFNGTFADVYGESWNFHTNVGRIFNRVRRGNDEIYTGNATASFDFLPGGSDKGRHNIQFGFWYEQRTNRRYDVLPRGLWNVARQQANNHIQGIPFDEMGNPLSDTTGFISVPGFGEVPLLGLAITESEDNFFYRRIRENLGVGLDEFVNTDGLSPDQLSLDMFSAKELNDQFLLDYYGTDYLGNPFDGTFDDFFRATDADGIRTFPVAPNRPIYSAFYIQDKFTYKDVIFRLGLRVDRYDANTRVLKDIYSLYEIMGADEYHGQNTTTRPGGIGEDYKVYLNGEGSAVQAYRDGDQWYTPQGTPVNNPNQVIVGGLVNPQYRDPRVADNPNFIKARDFDPSVSFEDYEVQVNLMPRLAFSFPISEEANFFAHYDILVQRPPSNTIATARDYFYFTDQASQVKNNPNLRPERTIDYEVGFQQKLSNSSAIKVSAYYKELRDMIQIRVVFPVPTISNYTTYDNLDFGTVKGFSFNYDLRRTGNVSVNANYTLQFADGTGSDANSQRNISSRGVLRTLFPLNYDERHRIVAGLDYRYGTGSRYNGPEWFGTQFFAGAGLNLQAIAVSGRPYTAQATPLELDGAQTVGAINGARNPWNFTINARVDKNFKIGKSMGLNVYVRVSNLLDRRNTIQVYSATGSPSDDGFLRSARGITQLNAIDQSARDVESYLSSYQWRILNPNFFSLPRRIFAGLIFDF